MNKYLTITFLALAAILAACEVSESIPDTGEECELRLDAYLATSDVVSRAAPEYTLEAGGELNVTVDDQSKTFTVNNEKKLVPVASATPFKIKMGTTSKSLKVYGTLNWSNAGKSGVMPAIAVANTLDITWTNDMPSASIALSPASAMMTVNVVDASDNSALTDFTITSTTFKQPKLSGGNFVFDATGTLEADANMNLTAGSNIQLTPATVAVDAPLFTLTGTASSGTFAGKTFTVSNTTGAAYVVEAAKHYTVTITVESTTVVNISTSIAPFGTGDVINVTPPPPPPYDRAIYTKADLIAFRNDVNSGMLTLKGIQMADIDLAGEEWIPIGNSNAFTGLYNGNGYAINNLTMNAVGNTDAAALFNKVGNDAILTDIHLKNVDITGTASEAGALVSDASGTSTNPVVISLCSATGRVSGKQIAGGLVADAVGVHITRCHTAVETVVVGENIYRGENIQIGGIVGRSIATNIAACSASGTVTANTNVAQVAIYAGGLIGTISGNASLVTTSYSIGAVTITNITDELGAGGLIGYGHDINIKLCYAISQVNAEHKISSKHFTGALVGIIGNVMPPIINCNAILTNTPSGRFIGYVADLPEGCTILASHRPNTVGAPGSPNAQTITGIKTTIKSPDGYGIQVAERSFRSDKVWIAGEMPKINYNYSGE